MKRRGHLIGRIADPENLRLAYLRARQGKTKSTEVLTFTNDLDGQLSEIRTELLNGRLDAYEYRRFTIFEPKQREICAGPFRLNVIHHAIMNVCGEDFERKQIFDSYACRKGKGTHAAVKRAQCFARNNGWYLKLDVKNFFADLSHAVILQQLRRLFKEEKLLSIFAQTLQSYEVTPGRGLPLGNLTSQYFANHYLTPVDRIVKQTWRLPYVRYMDDFVIWSDDKQLLCTVLRSITDEVEQELCCHLKTPVMQPTRRGMSFLGYRIMPYRISLTKKSYYRLRVNLRSVETAWQEEVISDRTASVRAQSLISVLSPLQKSTRKITLLRG